MGVEFRILRKDNKTVFDLGKSYGDTILNFIFSQEELLEYLIIYQLQLWHRDSPLICSLMIRDRLLDFVEGAGIDDLEVVTDHWWENEKNCNEGYVFTHDRYLSEEDIGRYWDLLQRCDPDEYRNNPVQFFKNSGIERKKCRSFT